MNINSPNVAWREDSKVSSWFLKIMELVEYRIAKICHDFHHCCTWNCIIIIHEVFTCDSSQWNNLLDHWLFASPNSTFNLTGLCNSHPNTKSQKDTYAQTTDIWAIFFKIAQKWMITDTSWTIGRKHYQVISETHKGLKRVTRVQCSWIFTFTIFGNLSDRYPFSIKWLPRDHHAGVLRQEFCISGLKIHR